MTKENSRLHWLLARLSSQRIRISGLLRRLCNLTPGMMKPAVFSKFIKLVDQIAVAKEHENTIICRIEAIEARHRFQRKRKMLRHPSLDLPEPRPYDFFYEARYKNLPKTWLWFLALTAYMSRLRISQRMPTLTMD